MKPAVPIALLVCGLAPPLAASEDNLAHRFFHPAGHSAPLGPTDEPWQLVVPDTAARPAPADFLPEAAPGVAMPGAMAQPQNETSQRQPGWIFSVLPGRQAVASTAMEDSWATPPALLALRQHGGWVYGVELSQRVVAGPAPGWLEHRTSLVQPFLAHAFDAQTSLTLSSAATYDRTQDSWAVPIDFTVRKSVRHGKQKLKMQFGVRYWARSPTGGPEGWGLRAAWAMPLPK